MLMTEKRRVEKEDRPVFEPVFLIRKHGVV